MLVKGKTSEEIFDKLDLKESSVYKVTVKHCRNNPEHSAILFTGFRSGGYNKVYNNSYEAPVPLSRLFSIKNAKRLTKLE